MDKSKIVKDLFENTDLYLTYDYNLQIRQETVASFIQNLNFQSVLDMPCGTGTISLPMLDKCTNITLIDISANMVNLAKKNIPENKKQKALFINDDFFKLDIADNSYDMVLCLGNFSLHRETSTELG
jgi:ubiquinone/menaquinone biosynthesis C-methylase UbiE